MKNLVLETIIKQIDGKIASGADNIIITDVLLGLKNVKPDSLVFDIYHQNYVKQMENIKNSPYVIVTDAPENFKGKFVNQTIVRVPNIKTASLRFVNFYRNLFDIPLIGVTGTCGKTTTKEMIKHILSQKYKVNATYKSLNAQYRHMRYLMDIDDSTQAAVIEMGVASRGDLKIACQYFKPQTGVITNIGVDHLNAFGTLEAYIKGKAEFLDGLDNKGTLILNADDENIKKIDISNYKGKIIYFGENRRADYRISYNMQTQDGIEFLIQYKNEVRRVHLPINGDFNAYNATAAIAAVEKLGFSLKDAIDALATFHNVERHFEIKQGLNGSTLIDDTWSTNPTSTESALEHLKALSHGKKTVAILGKMSLLGRQSEYYHNRIGKKIAELGINKLVAVGEYANGFCVGAIGKGMDKNNVHFCRNSAEAYNLLLKLLDENTIALVKTSMLTSFADLVGKLTKQVLVEN
jgi:UDP-N-acetylmuramoyl-tripeptide--D-alanyl-D-alanine ligase